MSCDEDLSFPFMCEGPSTVLEIFGESCARLSRVSSGTEIIEKEEVLDNSSVADCEQLSFKAISSIPIMEGNTNTNQDVSFTESKEELSETATNSDKIMQLSECSIKDNGNEVCEKMKNPGHFENDDSAVVDKSEKHEVKSKSYGEGSKRLDVMGNSKNVTQSQKPGSKVESCEVTLIEDSQCFEEELDSLEKLAMERVNEIESDFSRCSKQDSVSNIDSDLLNEVRKTDLNEEGIDSTLDKRSIASDLEVLSCESVQTYKDELSNNEKKSFEDSDSSSSLVKSDSDLIVKEDLSNTSDKIENSLKKMPENPELLKNGKYILSSTKCEDSSDNQSSADHTAVATVDNNIMPVSGTDNSEQSSEKESENITNQVQENMEIAICDQIPSDSEDSKGEKMTSTISSESPMNIEIDESVSCDASCDLNKPEGLSSSDSSKLPSTEKENCTESDDVKNYETEDDDLKVLEAFIVKSATNPEIAVCQTKQNEESTTKYSLESSLLDDLTKTDEVESVTNVTKHEGITSPKSSPKSTVQITYQSETTSCSMNSKLSLSEELERASLEIASVLDSCPPPELKTKNVYTRRPTKPKYSCCVGKILPLKKRLSPRKITDVDDRVDDKHDNLLNVTIKNLSKSLKVGTVKRGRGRPPGSGKKLKLGENLTLGEIPSINISEPQEKFKEDTFEDCGIVGIEENTTEKCPILDYEALNFPRKLQTHHKNTERVTKNTESVTPLRSNRLKRKIQEGSIVALGSVAKANKVSFCDTHSLNDIKTNLFVQDVSTPRKLISIDYPSQNMTEIEKTYNKKSIMSRINYPICTNVLTYDQLKSKAKEITLPSTLWSVQVDAHRDCIAFLGAASDISEAKLIVEKAILFEKSLKPVLILKNEVINVPYSSLDNFEDVVLLIENFDHLQVCEGTAIKQRPFSKYCYKFVDVANTGQRCSQCVEERRRVLFCYTRKLREKLKLLEKT